MMQWFVDERCRRDDARIPIGYPLPGNRLALVDEEEATLKRFRRRGASIALEPANAAYEVKILPPNRVRIQGKLVGLFRRY